MRIFIIDDEPKVRRALRRMIEELGGDNVVVGEAGTGDDGLLGIEQCDPDLLFLDVALPGMTGIEVFDRLRERELPVQVAMVSGYNDFEYVKHALVHEAVDYILKPFDLEDIRKAAMKAKERMDQKSTQQHTERLYKQMKQETHQHHHEKILEKVYYGQPMNEHELAQIPFLSGSQAYYVSILIFPEYETVLNERFDKDRQLLAYAIDRFIHEHNTHIGKDSQPVVGLSGRYDWSTYIVSPAVEPISHDANMTSLLESFKELFKLHCFHLTMKHAVVLPELSGSIHQLENSLFYTNLVELADTAKTPSFPTTDTLPDVAIDKSVAFAERVVHAMKHRLQYRITPDVDDLFHWIESSRQLTVMLLFQTWITFRSKLRSELGVVPQLDIAIETVDQMALTIQFHSGHAKAWFVDSLHKVMDRVIEESLTEVRTERATIIKEYIDLFYQDELTLASLAQQFFVSKEYLANQFKKHYGQTVLQYIQHCRLTASKRLLLEGDLPVSTIATTVGYDHFSYFNKVFKRETGITPTAYREQYRTH